MKINKSTVVLVTISFLLGSMTFFLPAYGETGKKQIEVTYRNIGIQVNGEEIESEQESFLFQDRVYAPLRTIGEAIDKEVTWDNEASKVLIENSPTDSKSNSDTFCLCYPLHSIGERSEEYPLALTIKKVYKETNDYSGEDLLHIDLTIENVADQPLAIEDWNWYLLDDQGNHIAKISTQWLPDSIGAKSILNENGRGFLYVYWKDVPKNKHLRLLWFPTLHQPHELRWEPFEKVFVYNLGTFEE
ncbi:MAG: stalk domain-containing protein [Caldisericia bacterium]|nr:stalk domain-containing protein [Caldisericia bacterium]MDD4614758.1 stalk domain-containing protein [Caldisericia bacterium]